MALESVKTVKPSGGDYTSLSAWEAGEQADIVTADIIAVAECYSFQDTTSVAILGWTTDATRYIEIRTPLTERHAGVWDTNKYYLNVAVGRALYAIEENVRFTGLQITNVDSTMIRMSPAGVSDIRISNCICKGNATNYKHVLYATAGAVGSKIRIWNNIIYDQTGTSGAGINLSSANTDFEIWNNTIKDCARGITFVSAASMDVKNNLVDSVNCYNGAVVGDYNSSSDATDTGGANDRKSQTFTYVDEAGNNFHLAVTDVGAKDFGMTDPGTGLFSDDIDGDARSAPWDIGADEYVAPPAPPATGDAIRVHRPPIGTGSFVAKTGTPTGIEGLEFWGSAFDSDKWKEIARTTPAEPGDAIGAVSDLGNQERHVTQATAGNKPVYTANQFGHLPGIVFDATDTMGGSGAITFAGDISLVIYLLSTQVGVVATSLKISVIATGYGIGIDSDGTNNSARATVDTSGAASQVVTGVATDIKDGNAHLVIVTYNRNTAKARVYTDGVGGTEKAIVGAIPTTLDLITMVAATSVYTVADAIIYSKVLSQAEIDMLQDYYTG